MRPHRHLVFRALTPTLHLILGAAMFAASVTPGRASADQLSIPTDLIGGSGLEAEAPVSVGSITPPGFNAIAFNVSYDSAVLSATGAELGTAAAGQGCLIESNNISATEIRVALACSGQIAAAGELVRLVFDVIGTAGNTSALSFVPSTCQIDERPFSACTTSDGLLTVVANRTLSGKVIYYNGLETRPLVTDERPVEDVTVNLSGSFTDSDDTAADGTYSLAAIEGQLTVQPRKRGGYNGAITAFDAALVAQHLAALITLNARQQFAADANGTGSIAPNDASQIARFVVGSVTELKMEADCNTAFALIPDATSVPNQSFQQPNSDVRPIPTGPGCVYGELRYNPLTVDATGQDFIAILMGDVSGNWQPAGGPTSVGSLTAESRAAGKSAAKLSIGKRPAKPGKIVTLPVTIANARGAIGIDLVLLYDASVLAPLPVEKTALSQSFTLEQNIDEPGVIRISLFGVEALNRSGILLQAPFSVIGQEKVISPVEIGEALVNEGAALVRNGHVSVK